MRTILISAAALSVLYMCLGAGCPASPQSISEKHATVSNPEIFNLPTPGRRSRPKLSLESALKIAKSHVEKAKINVSSYWLYQARFTLYGENKSDDKGKLPCWDFTWLDDQDGHALEVVVFMDGNPMILPTL